MKIKIIILALAITLINTSAFAGDVASAINQAVNKTAIGVDSTQLMANNPIATARRSESYVDTNNCVDTQKSVFVVVAGIGGGKLDQSCPADHPVMYQWKQTVAYTTAVPWSGAVMGAGGDTAVKCCATATRWVNTNSGTTSNPSSVGGTA